MSTYESEYDEMQATLAAILNGDEVPEGSAEVSVASGDVSSEVPVRAEVPTPSDVRPVEDVSESSEPEPTEGAAGVALSPPPVEANDPTKGTDFDFDDVMGMFDDAPVPVANEPVDVKEATPDETEDNAGPASDASGGLVAQAASGPEAADVHATVRDVGSEVSSNAAPSTDSDAAPNANGGSGGEDGSDGPSLDDLIASADQPADSGDIIFKDAPSRTASVIPMPEFTTDEIAEQIDIRNLATLVTLNTARWHGKVKDRKASEYAAATAGASAEAFETHKRLLAGADEKLRRVHKAIDDARTKHYRMTLPWSTTGREDQGKRKGAALLPNAKFFDYTKEMAHAKVAMEEALDTFVQDYASAIAQAKTNLGNRFDPNEYPHPTTIRDHFGLSFDFHPIPVGRDFQGLAEQQIEKLSRKLEQKNRKMIENAMQEAWTRAYELVAQAADRFGSPDRMFHYTLIDKLRDAASSLGTLNLTGDPVIEKVRATIQKHMTMHDADSIRGDEALRDRLGKIAAALLKEMRDHAGAA